MLPPSSNLFVLIQHGVQYLENHKIDNSKKELEWFCQEQLQKPLVQLKRDYNIQLSTKEKNIFKNFLLRRGKQEPFQYIMRSAPFYNNIFFVNQSVLIPRPETETFIRRLKGKEFNEALDIGTGCGNLAITLRKEKIVKTIDAIDISEEALVVANKNSQNLNVKNVVFQKKNILHDKMNKKYDLIVSNPPYISNKDYNELPKHIKKFEPQLALTDNDDGFLFYNFFFKNLHKILKPKGTIMLEIGHEKTKPIIEKIFSKKYVILWHKDLNGNNRILELHV